ncbi:hypothetical protein PF327_10860 [Sulfurovum sp. XTW-4]|uniref:Uncharacterized protein n=1 Tax=Sulfurovum xiamenensis TaxID=3019066 RepID=A0ABT7QUK1_9BACT|nr:hypothetical protein [Sulfurovum xiamenensis]MDM5264695.1 hypothetical protein [Sulfurovum xiamenensis]
MRMTKTAAEKAKKKTNKELLEEAKEILSNIDKKVKFALKQKDLYEMQKALREIRFML